MVLSTYDQFRQYFNGRSKLRSNDLHSNSVHTIAWSPDGRRLASGGSDKEIKVSNWDGNRLKVESTFKLHEDIVDNVKWHPTNSDVLASASADKTVRVWDVRNKRLSHKHDTRGQNINLRYCPDGLTLAYGDKDDRISFLDTRTWKIRSYEQYKTETNEFIWHPSGKFLFVATGIGQVYVYNWPDMKNPRIIQAHSSTSNCACLALSPDAKYMAVGGGDAIITIWDLNELICIAAIDRLDYSIRSVGFSFDSKILAGGSEDHFIDISFVPTGQRVHKIDLSSDTYSLEWHPKSHIVALSDSSKDSSDYKSNSDGAVKIFGLEGIN